jgi:hypothetical protein
MGSRVDKAVHRRHAGTAFARSRPAGAGQDPAYNLPQWIRPECNSLHRLSGEGVDLRFGLALVLRERHPLTDDLSALAMFRFHARSLSTVCAANFAAAPTVLDEKETAR